MDKERQHNSLSNAIYAIKYVSSISKLYVIGIVLVSLLSAILILVNLALTRYILKFLSNESQGRNIYLVIIGVCCASIFLQTVNTFLNSYVSSLLLEKIRKEIYLDLYRKTLDYSLLDMDDASFYNEYFYVINNAEGSMLNTVRMLGQIATSLFSAVGLTIYLASVDLTTLGIVLVGALGTCGLSALTKKIQYRWDIQSIPERREINYLNRVFYLRDYAKEVRSYASSGIFESKYQDTYEKQQCRNKKYAKKIFFSTSSMYAVQTSTNVAIMLVLVSKVIFGEIPISEFVVLQNGALQLSVQVSSIISILPAFYENSLRIERIRHFLDKKNQSLSEIRPASSLLEIKSLECRNLSFDYKDSGFRLSNINLKIEKGKKIAIVGNNGAGKSTLVKIMCGLYPSSNCSIFINDSIPAETVLETCFHNRIGVVFQDYQLFAFSIAENILMRPPQSDTDIDIIVDSLKFAGLYEKILTFEKGIFSLLTKEFSSDGVMLSGGELQKLALARVYAHNFDIIIFDELTSSFDPFAEDEIYKMIDKISESKAIVYISHRLINMQDMDEILRMDKGRIVERGTHEELLKRKSGYFEMYRVQAQKYALEGRQ